MDGIAEVVLSAFNLVRKPQDDLSDPRPEGTILEFYEQPADEAA